MEEFLKNILTPQTFAMGLVVWLLWKHDKTLKQNTNATLCLIQFFSSLNGKLKAALDDVMDCEEDEK